MMKKKLSLLLFALIAVFMVSVSSCKKDKGIDPTTDPVVVDPVEVTASEIDTFIWNSMNKYYLWYQNVPNLADSRFSTDDNNEEFYTFLNTYSTHEGLFYDILYEYGTIDKWSWIVDDYVALEDLFQGISLSVGMEFGVVRLSDSDELLGYVRYVVPDSPADLAGIKRGEVFTAIDGQDLDINNYRSLLYGRDALEIYFADIVGTTIIPNGKVVSLTAVEVHENPIHYTEIIESEGKKIGYLLYNAFQSNYDLELNEVFGEFKSEGVQELILDFRYNGGGSVQTAAYLASMIYDTDPDKVFAIKQYNDKLEDIIRREYGSDFFNIRFESVITKDVDGQDIITPINTLNLSKVYIITTGSSASASELIINGLDPYIDVITVGGTTHGKYVGSFTIKDEEWDAAKGEWVTNPNHIWALQPITLKIANSLGVSDYVDGFAPTIEVYGKVADMLPFGDENEPMLKAALNAINGIAQMKSYSPVFFEEIADSKDFKPHSKEMYLEDDLLRTIRTKHLKSRK
ncbi:MAG: hypothetical protein GY834_00880 [Bacteroidetes bacterium]|nr:hypothetical protein [Bacteroidota bacterium]